MAQYRISFGNLGWRGRFGLVAITIIGLAVALALIVVSLGVALVIVPVAAVAFLIARWRMRGAIDAARRAGAARARGAAQQIEPGYRVLETEVRGQTS